MKFINLGYYSACVAAAIVIHETGRYAAKAESFFKFS